MDTPLNDSKLALLYLAIKELNTCIEPETLLRSTLLAAVRLSGASRGSIFVQELDDDFVWGLLLDEATITQVETETVSLMMKKGLAGWVRQHHKTALIPNTAIDSRWYARAEQDDTIATKSVISVPLFVQDRILGVLTLSHTCVNHFTEVDANVNVIEALAEHSATTMARIQLYQAEKRQRKLANAIAELAQKLPGIHTQSNLLALGFEQFQQIFTFECGVIFLWDKNYLAVSETYGVESPAEMASFSVELYKNDFARPLLEKSEPILTKNLQKEETWFKDTPVFETANSWMGIPLVSGELQLGIVTFAHKDGNIFGRHDMSAAVELGRQLASAIHDQRLLLRLQNIEKRYTSLFEESSDCLLIVEPTGIIRGANRKACRLFRRPKDVIVGSHVALLDASLNEVLKRHRANLAPGKTLSDELIVKDAYGQSVALEITARYINFDGETVFQWTGYDITAKKELAAMRQDLTNMIVHDLRGPTSTLMGAVQMLEMLVQDIADAELRAETSEIINLATRSGQYLRDLIDSVLDLSKLERGDFPLHITPVVIQEIFDEVSEQTTAQATFKDIELTFPPPIEATAHLDHSIIRRVLVNLIDNATKYTPSGGHVQVSITHTKHQLVFAVSDDGPGITSDSQKHIFEKFARATANAAIQGVGLGLAFCKLAIEAHRGAIWLDSVPNKGSNFYFSIPDDLEPEKLNDTT